MMTWKKRGFAGTGFAGEERVLARAFADGQILQFGRAGAPDRHAQFAGRFFGPQLRVRRRDLLERHLHAVRVQLPWPILWTNCAASLRAAEHPEPGLRPGIGCQSRHEIAFARR